MLLVLTQCGSLHADGGGQDKQVAAPFYTPAEYQPPEPGSYELPPLGMAANGRVLEDHGRAGSLHDYLGDKLVLLSFIYSTCTDANGCPLATAVLYSLLERTRTDAELRGRLRLVSLSFDPEFDTPEVMRAYGAAFADSGGDWRFLTTASQAELDPILDGYGQSVIRDLDEQGRPLPSYSHILRVFLIDREMRIRNIYSVSFLYTDLIANDVKTLLREEAAQASSLRLVSVGGSSQGLPLQDGDHKGGYERDDYQTRSLALELRQGHAADLLQSLRTPPLGLPPIPVPADNPVTGDKVALGRKLFYDRRLSLNDTFSCAMCHVPDQGFTSHELSMAVGIEGRSVRRNSPTLFNTAYLTRLFLDGREDNLEQQVWGPLLARNEMGNPSVGTVLRKIRRLPDYAGLFEAAFDGRGPGMETVGMALASYERVLVSGNSPFDRWHYGGDAGAVSAGVKRGFSLFTGKAGCSACHTLGDRHALFTDNDLHNTGTGYRESMGIRPEKEKVLIAPGVYMEIDRSIIEAVGEDPPTDVGLYEVTENPFDRWKYRTPSLRNVALTAPYMHNGSIGSLREVVEFYNRGGVPNELQDPRIHPLGLDDGEMDDLVAFLQSLTGDNVETLVADAFAAPVGDLSREDPNWAHALDGGAGQ